MDKIKLKISIKDWLYIVVIALFLGFFLSLVFYFLNEKLQESSTIVFTTISAGSIAIYSFVLISISNEYILPKIDERFWYIISFIFSFLSGFLGFLNTFYLFSQSDFFIVETIKPHSFYVATIIGFLTFLIGLILHQFISMKYKNEIIKREVYETKIKALENELNPHFLFNALNSISELIYIDQAKAEKALIILSKFLRNAITKESLIPISTEIDMVKTYVNIENIRFEDKIKFFCELDNKYKNIKIPKFSIQLLVENSIKHGFYGEELKVDIQIDDNKIKVSNNGLLPKEKLTFGVGLNNLKRRLQLLNIGILSYIIKDKKIVFIIDLRG